MSRFITKQQNVDFYFSLNEYGNRIKLGEGSNAVVFKGFLSHDTNLNVPVAIKSLRRRNLSQQTFNDMAEEECEVLVFFNNLEGKTGHVFYPNNDCHPNIVKLYACLMTDMENKRLVIELMHESLETYIDYTMPPLFGDFFLLNRAEQFVETKKIMKAILNALAFIHANGFIHCDIKADNILITKTGDDRIDQIKLADMGASIKQEKEHSESAHMVTIMYRPPEVFLRYLGDEDPGHVTAANDIELKPSIDIYSLGVELFRILYKIYKGHSQLPDSYATSYPIYHSDRSNIEFLTVMARVYGNPLRDTGPDRWILGCEVIEGLHNRYGNIMTFAFIQKAIQNKQAVKELVDRKLVDIPAPWKELVCRMLPYNPDKRITATRALSLPVLDGNGHEVLLQKKGNMRNQF